MAKEEKYVKIFSPDTYSGGGTFFTDGLYRVEEARFVKYDYNGKAPGKDGNGITSLSMKLQPVNKDGEDAGDVAVQYWSVGDDFEPKEKGHSIVATGQYDTIWKLSDFGVFYEYLGKNGFDIDKVEDENDIAVLDGSIFEFGKIPSPRTQQKVKEDDSGKKQFPQQILVVVDANPTVGKGKGKSASTGSGKAASKPNGKTEDSDEEILQQYLVAKVLLEKNEAKGIDTLQGRMGINSYVTKDLGLTADKAKDIQKLYADKETLGPILESVGWGFSKNGQKIEKAEG